MVRPFLILSLLLSSGCLDLSDLDLSKLQIGELKQPCYDIFTASKTHPFTTILLNKCTGESYSMTQEVIEKKGLTESLQYKWYKIEREESFTTLQRTF